MRITAKLALSQLKRNRVRSLAALLAICLSTALIMTVCGFVASGNKMLLELLGEDYGNYGKTYFAMLLIPAVLFGIIIVAMAVVVISNVFLVSAKERIAQFGTLKCVGATAKQIVGTVMYESLFLSVIGIPCGIILGLLLTFLGVGVANHYFSELNSLVHMMMTEITLNLPFVVSWQACISAILVSFFAVAISAYLPARKASKVSAINSIRDTGEIKISGKQVRTGHWFGKVFGIEGELALKNWKRNKRTMKASVISLSVSVILFFSLGALHQIARNLESYLYPDRKQSVIVDYTSNYDVENHPVTGREETIYTKPIDSELGNQISDQLKRYDDTDFFGVGNDYDTYYTMIPESQISDEMLDTPEFFDGDTRLDPDTTELSVEIIVIDKDNYEALCKKAGVSNGSTILLNHYEYNDNGTEREYVPFLSSLKKLTLFKADGSREEVSIDAALTKEEIPEELMYPNTNTNTVRLVVPHAMVRGYNWNSAPADIDGYMAYANEVMKERFPEGEEESYMEAGYNTRVYKMNDYMKVMNIAIVLVSVFMYSFVILLTLIGFTNVVSTMTTNVQMRFREFAVLESVGMTAEGIRKMLNIESVLCSAKALLYGLPVGLFVTCLLNLCVRKVFAMPLVFPWKSFLLCIALVFFITWVTQSNAIRKFKNQNIIETIRSEVR